MRILFCNKYNFRFSGTEAYIFEVMDLLRSRGHEVALFSMQDSRGDATPYDHHFVAHIDFKARQGFMARAKLAAHAVYSTEARKRLRQMISAFRPDIAHVRNIYHHLSPSILWELKKQGIPALYHLNDFKMLCPTYNLVSNGAACEQPCRGKFWKVVSQRCYSGPLSASVILAAEAYVHYWAGTYEKCVDHFLVPSQFAKQLLIQNGFDDSKISVLNHFQVLDSSRVAVPGDSILYFGRLSAEKGVSDLIRAMKLVPKVHLVIAGDGPQRTELQMLTLALNLRNVEFVGQVQGDELSRLIDSARFTVLPSRAYETLGKSILESFARGRAVIASDLGSRRELVHEDRTGLLHQVGNVEQLAGAISYLHERPDIAMQMGLEGRKLVETYHSPEKHYQELITLYDRLRSRESSMYAIKPSTGPIRVAFIGGRGVISKYSGIETYYEEVGKRLVAMGYDVTIYCRSYFTPALETYEGMRLVRLPTMRSKHLETLVHTILSTMHVIFTKCDIVHYHALGPALFSLAPRLVLKKTVVTVQGLDWQRRKWGWCASLALRLGEIASAFLPDLTIVVSKQLQRYYRSQYDIETKYIPNGATLRQRSKPMKILEWGLDPDNYVLFLGRFSPEKNLHLLIEAYEMSDINLKLALAGGSSHTDAYESQLRKHGSQRIVFLDWVSGDELSELLTNAALFVLPSELEGLSLALLDAMGAGRCVLASDIPENREVIEDAGFTFRAGDVEDLARMLALLASDPEVRAAAGRAGRKIVEERYLWSQIANEVAIGYERLTGRQIQSSSTVTVAEDVHRVR
ncbi:MAG: glycosyltransferase family 4 protein, partial [Acidobacteriaceae bacterium]|nr:glycosyltransferase family 4 protein [Acidobacteriaceae bacterium]